MQVGNFIHYLATFLAGLVVGFVSAWRLALLSIAVIPGIAFAGGLYAYTLTGLTSKSRDSYANAGIIAEQVVTRKSQPPALIWACTISLVLLVSSSYRDIKDGWVGKMKAVWAL